MFLDVKHHTMYYGCLDFPFEESLHQLSRLLFLPTLLSPWPSSKLCISNDKKNERGFRSCIIVTVIIVTGGVLKKIFEFFLYRTVFCEDRMTDLFIRQPNIIIEHVHPSVKKNKNVRPIFFVACLYRWQLTPGRVKFNDRKQ